MLSCVPGWSASISAGTVSLLAFSLGDDFHLQVVSGVNPILAIVKGHILFISFLRREKRENYEPLLAAIQFPQEILAFFEEHATACSEESLRKQKGNSIVAHFQWTSRRGGNVLFFPVVTLLSLGKLIKEALLSVPLFTCWRQGPIPLGCY